MKIANKLSSALLLMAIFIGLWSCSDEPKQQSQTAQRTVLVYILANNSLNGYDLEDIEEMKTALNAIGSTKCRLVIYQVNKDSSTPRLYELKRSGKDAIEEVTLKTYDSTPGQSVTTKRMSQVLNDVKQMAPAADYAMVLWSHSNGWALTKSGEMAEDVVQTGFGDDNGATMPIDSLSQAIPDGMMSFIWADACYLGAIEVAYELRNDTRYFVGSPTETMSQGMPYDLNLPCFFESTPNLTQACVNMYDYYNSMSNEQYRSITICLVDCQKLDAVAQICKQIDPKNKDIDRQTLQYYNSSKNRFLFDFMQTYKQIATSEQYERLQQAYNQAIKYKAATPSFIGLTIDPANYSGLSTYILGSSSDPNNEAAYRNLSWYKYIYVTP
ncbi:MAG: clostripain-related cysteine peptidase [Muribaculaceae bacterium]